MYVLWISTRFRNLLRINCNTNFFIQHIKKHCFKKKFLISFIHHFWIFRAFSLETFWYYLQYDAIRFTMSLLSTCCPSGSSTDIPRSLKVKDKRDTRCRAIPMPLFTSATNMKPMHRLTPNFLARDSDPFPSPFLLLSRRVYPFHALGLVGELRELRSLRAWNGKVHLYSFRACLFHLYGKSASA